MDNCEQFSLDDFIFDVFFFQNGCNKAPLALPGLKKCLLNRTPESKVVYTEQTEQCLGTLSLRLQK